MGVIRADIHRRDLVYLCPKLDVVRTAIMGVIRADIHKVSPYMIFIGLITLSSCCSSDSDEDVQPAPQEPVTDTRVPITFSGQQGEEQVGPTPAHTRSQQRSASAAPGGLTFSQSTTPFATREGGEEASGVKANRAYEANEKIAATRAAVTRAGTPLSDLNVHSFKVWGYKNMEYTGSSYGGLQTVMPAYTVNWINNSAATTVTNSSGWEYLAQEADNDPEQTPKYWDWGAAAYRFFALTAVGANEPNEAHEPNETRSFTMTADASPIRTGEGTADQKIAANIADAPYFTKLWFSTGNAGDYPTRQFGQPVQLEFLKPFARVRFLFIYSYASEGIKVRKKEFKPSDGSQIYRKGTVTVTYPLEGTATSESYSVTPVAVTDVYTAVADGTTLTSGNTYYTSSAGDGKFVSNGTEESNGTNYFTLTDKRKLDAFTEEYIAEGSEKWYTVLPALSQGSYTMYVRMNNDAADKTAVVPAEYMTWLPGYSYTYIFKITEEGGIKIDMVQSAVTPWVPMSGNHEVYNW